MVRGGEVRGDQEGRSEWGGGGRCVGGDAPPPAPRCSVLGLDWIEEHLVSDEANK